MNISIISGVVSTTPIIENNSCKLFISCLDEFGEVDYIMCQTNSKTLTQDIFKRITIGSAIMIQGRLRSTVLNTVLFSFYIEIEKIELLKDMPSKYKIGIAEFADVYLLDRKKIKQEQKEYLNNLEEERKNK